MGEIKTYYRVVEAKKFLKAANSMGWPETEEGIRDLIATMGEAEQAVCYGGRFVKKWSGWQFMFPPTHFACDVLDGKTPNNTELRFTEDEEG